MSFVNNNLYREIPFCLETRYNDFYTYVDLKDIYEKCEEYINDIIRCRTVGILQSINGRYYLSDFDSSGTRSEPVVQVSMAYMQSSPQSTVVPYPVQIFGTLQWKNRPVIFSNILQVMSIPTAIRLKNALSGITSAHLAKPASKPQDEEDPT